MANDDTQAPEELTEEERAAKVEETLAAIPAEEMQGEQLAAQKELMDRQAARLENAKTRFSGKTKAYTFVGSARDGALTHMGAIITSEGKVLRDGVIEITEQEADELTRKGHVFEPV